MRPLSIRSLCAIAFAVTLSGCQFGPKTPQDPYADDYARVEQSLAAGRPGEAQIRLNAMPEASRSDPRNATFRQRLSDAYLQQGRRALQAGDMDTATKALSHARSLMPSAPALTTGLDGAVEQARNAQKAQQEADRARADAERAAAEAAEAAQSTP
ncbi:hypothetical protein [Pseudomonas matsuisoli]|uniref:Tetratricopeptide repeat-containing protein n=1 Tax=Pseudomonas matsuisoli TaxID=1515666 RepID=A0A917PW41_9PSED|nr:hypothetical protein [Pseudomonas matsuisoli]GGJ95591.1 hypothetical protein GCM10009304_22000 [Pseudomonas matsuisoli]